MRWKDDIMYAKAKVSMEWVEFMTRKYDIGMFLVYIIILCLIVSYKYPQNSENLMKMTSDDPFVIENKEFTLADYAYTENKSSFFFLLKDENDKLVLQEKKIFPIQYLCIVLTAVVLIIRILVGFIKK